MTEPVKKEKRNVVNIKERLYNRLDVLRACVKDAPVDRLDHHFLNEIEFLEDILDWIERN
jgi:hypothetical protein